AGQPLRLRRDVRGRHGIQEVNMDSGSGQELTGELRRRVEEHFGTDAPESVYDMGYLLFKVKHTLKSIANFDKFTRKRNRELVIMDDGSSPVREDMLRGTKTLCW